MFLNLILIAVGVVLVLWGADRLTDGAVAIASKMQVSAIVIGLTVVAMGTSMPEFFVSFMSAIKGTPDLAVGNVVGSNVMNTLLIVGVAAMVSPMIISCRTVKKDIPFAVMASAALFLLIDDGSLARLDAGILFILFVMFMIATLHSAKSQTTDSADVTEAKPMGMLRASFFIVLGIACLIFGSNIFVESAKAVASAFGISEAVVGLTIVAGGTSLPELATSVVAARKGQSAIAIGNVLGSNVFNILMILGVTGIIQPMTIQGITPVDLALLLSSIMLVWLFSFTKYTVARWEGLVLTLIYIVYLIYLILNAI